MAAPSEKDRDTVTRNTYIETAVKFGRVVFEICEQTEKLTDK